METVSTMQISNFKFQNAKTPVLTKFRYLAISLPRYLATSLLLLFFSPVFSQSPTAALQEAFSKSQLYESRGNFTDAVSVMKAAYQEDSYETNQIGRAHV